MLFSIYKSYLLFLLLFLSISNYNKLYAQNNLKQSEEITQNITSVFQKFELDLSEEVITIDDWAKNIIYSIYDWSKLPSEYKDLERSGLTTDIILKIFNNWSRLSRSTKQELQNYGLNDKGAFIAPNSLQSESESTHFKFHYSIVQGDTNAVNPADNDLNGIPDYIDMMILAFENAFESEIDSMGFTPPPSDSGNIGDNSRYDIYVQKLKSGAYGFASPFSTIGDNPNSNTLVEKNATTSYIKMRNDYSELQNNSQLEAIQVTAAHEFFHAIQFGYDAHEMTWLMEATATWIEDEVFDNVNQNIIYLNSWFRFPTIQLDATKTEFSNHWYGSWIFFKYISEHLGGHSTIKNIWEKSIEHDSKTKDYSFLAIDEALVKVGSSFDEAFKNFAVSNLYQTITPYNYEEAELYPQIHIDRSIFQTKIFSSKRSKRHSARYFRIYPNVLPGNLDEIEFTVTPENDNTELELLVVTKIFDVIETKSTTLNGGIINYSLKNSSTKDEIYAIVVNLDSTKTEYNLEITYKGNLIQLSNSNKYNYSRISDNFLIYKHYKDYTDSNGDFHTDFTVSRYSLRAGYVFDYLFRDTNGLDAYLAKSGGDMFIIANDFNTSFTKRFGYHFASLKELAGEFEVNQFPAVDNNIVYFYGDIFNPDFSRGILTSDLKNGNPQMILNLTDTDFKIDIIESEENSFVALKNSLSNPNIEELISYRNNSVSTFYTPNSGNTIRSLVFDSDFAVWSESDAGFSNESIKAFNFSTNNLETIRSVSGLDVWSVATSSKRIVWWENTTGATQIKLWMNDTTTTIRSTFNGLYLSDNGVSSNSFDIPIDTGGVAWMEDDFNLYYYNFSSSSLNSYDLSDYFTDKFMTSYLVDLTGKNVIIQAISSVSSEKVGIYLFKLGEVTTGINDRNHSIIPMNFSLSQNYPNPFNPTTIIEYSLPSTSGLKDVQNVQLKIYDILGREIKILVNEKQSPGNYKVNFRADNLSSGVYFYKIISGSFTQTKKMLLLQ